jgi:ribose 1,5-bisphosphokinase
VKGRLIYVVGPSGSGKDSLLAWVRAHLPAGAPIAFAHRYITRPEGAGGENYVSLTEGEFAPRLERGLFAMHWASHGWCYGIGVEIDHWLARGLDVVVSGSRAYLPEALARYPDLGLVWVTAPAETLRARLERRGRESTAEIAARLERGVALGVPPRRPAIRILNDGPVERAGAELLAWLARDAAARRA